MMIDLEWKNTGGSYWIFVLLGILLLVTWILAAHVVLFLLGLALFTLGTALGSKRELDRRFRE